MIKLLIEIFIAFFIPAVIGYGGGPATIPLIEEQVVSRYGWLTVDEFAEILALGNTLPGPIATKMAAYIGFSQAGFLGGFIGLFATIAPSLILMITLLGILYKYKDSPKVKRLTNYVRPTIAVLLGLLAYRFFDRAYTQIGIVQATAISVISLLLIQKYKVHPAFIIAASLIYGAIFLG